MTGQLGPWINDWNAEKLEVIDIAGGDACAIGERDTGDERVGNVTMTCRLNRSRAGNRSKLLAKLEVLATPGV